MILRPQLSTIADNGRRLVRDFEFISKSPQNPVTSEHLAKVLMATNDNEATGKLLRINLAETWRVVTELIPSSQYLNDDIQHAFQVLRQNTLVRNTVGDPDWRVTLEDAKKENVQEHDYAPGGNMTYYRENFYGLHRELMEYYEATQVIAKELLKRKSWIKPLEAPWSDNPRLTYPMWDKKAVHIATQPGGEPYPYIEYPPTALSYAPMATLLTQNHVVKPSRP